MANAKVISVPTRVLHAELTACRAKAWSSANASACEHEARKSACWARVRPRAP